MPTSLEDQARTDAAERIGEALIEALADEAERHGPDPEFPDAAAAGIVWALVELRRAGHRRMFIGVRDGLNEQWPRRTEAAA